MVRGTWQATVHEVAKSQTQLSSQIRKGIVVSMCITVLSAKLLTQDLNFPMSYP